MFLKVGGQHKRLSKEGRICCSSSGCCQIDSAEHKGYDRAPTGGEITENNIIDADRQENGILEQILSAENLNRAYKQVEKNKDAHGVDEIKVEHLL